MIRHIHLDACDSTQDILKEQTIGKNESLLVSTEKQLKGRGRGLNQWEEIPGSLCFSLSLKPHEKISFTALEISLLLTRFFEFEGCKISLKWPNDLLDSRGLKCGGILIQGSGSQYFAGIGINLFSDHKEFGGVYREAFEFNKKSWSLRIAEFIIANRYVDTLELKNDWELRCSHLGNPVRIVEGNEITEGIFQSLGPNGEALINTAQGVKSIYNGTLRIISSVQ